MSDIAAFAKNMKESLVKIVDGSLAKELLDDKPKFNAGSINTLLDLQNSLSMAQAAQGALIGMCYLALGVKAEDVEVSAIDPTTVSFYASGEWVASMFSQRENLAHTGKSITLSTGISFSAKAFAALDEAGGCSLHGPTSGVVSVGAN